MAHPWLLLAALLGAACAPAPIPGNSGLTAGATSTTAATAAPTATPTAAPSATATATLEPAPDASGSAVAASAASATAPAPTPPVKQTLFVDAKRVPCEGEGMTECLRVRKTAKEVWTLFYTSIEGFVFEPGFEYELTVEVSAASERPADASSKRYRLVAVVSKGAVR